MRSLLAATLTLAAVAPPASAAIFTVKPGTIFYSQTEKLSRFQLDLPEVRVHVPPLKDTKGFCQFKLMYKIADRDNPTLPKTAWTRCVATDTVILD